MKGERQILIISMLMEISLKGALLQSTKFGLAEGMQRQKERVKKQRALSRKSSQGT